jgi:glycosyltransferase involved in cell wall biosynthesis
MGLEVQEQEGDMCPIGNSDDPEVTIYIASINTASATELCIRSINRHTPRNEYTLCVGDCGSTDDSLPRLMKLLRAGLIDDVSLAPRGRLHGAWLDHWTQSCVTQFAVIVDSDVEILKPDWLDTLVETARETDAAIVCSELIDEVPNYVDHTGVARRLARRPSAWMMLLNVAKCRGRSSWLFAMEDDQNIPEKQWGLDIGAQLMRDLTSAGELIVVAPAGHENSFRHFGGLSWMKMKTRRVSGWRFRAGLLKMRMLSLYVYVRLKWVKVIDGARANS